jgi:hypothetical protein
MRGKNFIKAMPIWLLSFLFVNILYIFFKDTVFYGISILLFSTILYIKIKNKSPFIMLELIILLISIVILLICIFNKEQIVLKIVIMNLENWLLIYLFNKKTIK